MSVKGVNHKLTWREFSKVPEPLTGSYAAETATETNVDFKYITKNDKTWHITSVTVTLGIDKQNSWVVKGKETKELLAHEQLHYDIAGIAARQLERAIAGLKGDDSQTAEEAVNALSDQFAADAQAIQDMYDEDLSCGSNHGLEKHHQTGWGHRVIKAKNNSKAQLSDLSTCPAQKADGADAGP